MFNVYVVGVLLMFVIYIVVGNYAGKRVKGIDDYYVSGRNAPTLLIVGTLIASGLSTVGFMGEIGFIYDGYGWPYIIGIALLNNLGFVFGSIFFGRYIRRSGALTIPSFFGDRFHSKRIRVLCGVVTVIGISGYLASVSQGTALLLQELMGIGYGTALLITWVTYVSFTIYAGSRGVLLTDTIMFIVFSAMALISVPYVFKATGGWPDAIQAVVNNPKFSGYYLWTGNTTDAGYMGTVFDLWFYCIIMGVIWMLVTSISPWQAGRYLMAKNEHIVIRSGVIAPVPMLWVAILIYMSMVCVNNIDIGLELSSNVYIRLALTCFPVVLGVLVCGGILSAGLSSCTTFLSLIGFSLYNDIYVPLFGKKGEEREMSLIGSRIVMLIVGGFALVFVYFQTPAVMWIGYFASTVFGTSWGIVGFMSIWSKKINEKGAFWGMICGLGVFLLLQILSKLGVIAFFGLFRPELLGLIASVIGIFIGNALGTRSEAEIESYEKLHVAPPEIYADKAAIRRTLMYPKFFIIGGVLLAVMLLILFALPIANA